MEFVKDIENNIKKFDLNTQNILRNRAIPIVNSFSSFCPTNNKIDKELIQLQKESKRFLNDNPEIILTKADKGNITVALNKAEYMNDINEMLQDTNTYSRLAKNPLNKLTTSVRELLARWKKHDYISMATYRSLYCSDGILPKAYGLPKVHKAGCPYRVIISSIDSPLYSLVTFLHNVIKNNIPAAKSRIDNSFLLFDSLNDKKLENDSFLISLDVVSLFTNIPIDLAVEGVEKRWDLFSNECKIPKEEFLGAIRLVLGSSFFTFDNVFYKQTFGTPMGSPLSPIIADFVMQDLENSVLSTVKFPIPIFYRYVDDILLAIPEEKIDFIFNKFSSFHPRLQFTLERGGDRINFLDTTVILEKNRIKIDWYHKPTFSGRLLNYWSHCPLSQKRGVIMGLADRAFLLSHPDFHQKNLIFVIKTLLRNDYPLDFIFNVISNRLKSLINRKIPKQNKISQGSQSVKWFTIPYVSNFSEKFKKVIAGSNLKLAYHSFNKLNSLIKVHKDKTPDSLRRNVVYKISCNDCDASYVGQTGRLLKTRVSEHKNHIRRNSPNVSVITNHRMQHNHDFDWSGVEVLDVERFYHKRLISEMLHINCQRNGINLQTDTDCLDGGYTSIFNHL